MRRPSPLIVALFVLVVVNAGVVAYASLNAPSAPTDPSSQSYTLGDVCNRLETGSTLTIATTFTTPESAPDQDMCSLQEIIDIAPTIDDTNCADPNEIANGKTYWGLCSGTGWGLFTGERPVSIIPRTGQTSCYDATGSVISCPGTGQDGEYQFGATASPRFTDNSDGTVTDNITGLIWLKNANCFGTNSFVNSLSNANGLASGACGLTDGSSAGDWRLPNIRELHSLRDYGVSTAPRIPNGHPFTAVQGTYWSSTTYRLIVFFAWSVNFGGDGINFQTKGTANYVWPVR